jgi:hypothetical protein
MTTGSLRAALGALLTFASLGLAFGCSSGDTSLGGNPNTCSGQNWRAATPDGVICPGAPDCLCSGGQVCCVALVNGKASIGSCNDLAACSGPAIACDGPEDCAAGQVCCWVDTVGGGSTCKAPIDCFGSQEAAACRDDSQCSGIEHCTPADPGSYLDGVAAACLL